MKKVLTIIGILALLLVGCSDATATISDGKEALFTIGKYSFTKKDLYDEMMNADQAAIIIETATNAILAKEVETTQEIKDKAQEQFDDYKKDLGEDFMESIKSLGCNTEEEFLELCINNQKHTQLYKDYIQAHYDDLYAQYAPFTAKIMFFDGNQAVQEALENAQKALEELNAGKTFEDVSKNYKCDETKAKETIYLATDSSLDYNLLTWVNDQTTPTTSQVITNKAGNGYYIVRITNKSNREQIKDQFVEKLISLTEFTNKVDQEYFKKYGFTVYDIDVYNIIKNNYPTYLVQE